MKGEWGRKKQENKKNMGGRIPNNNEKKKPKWWKRKKKTKGRVFIIWHMNLLAPVEFARPHWMATKMDSITTVKWRP
jgi:hypothetical protein